MSVSPGVCKKQTNTSGYGIGNALSTTKNLPNPLEYGRTVSAAGLSALKYGAC
jgi:hypothetical protein